MKLDRKLNLVVPVEVDSGTIYVHSMPVTREVFEQYFLVISKTFSAIYSQGLHAAAGPRVAAMLLKSIAVDLGQWEGPGGVENGLMNEIRRLTNVVMPGSSGWTTVPYDTASAQGLLSDDDKSEIENAIVFFIVASAMHKKKDLASILTGAGKLWDSRIESLNCTEYARSLPISTETASTGATVAASSIPS